MDVEKSETIVKPLSSNSKALVKRLIGDKAYYQMRAGRHIARHRRSSAPLLFVHQMGKVGSTSVVATLEQQGVSRDYIMYQTHFLTPRGYALLENLELTGHGGWEHVPDRGKSFLSMSRVLMREIGRNYLQDRTVKVISLVRDPVATNLSGYFHNTAWWPQELRDVAVARHPGWQDRLWAHFVETYPHSVPAIWFDLELKPLFNIDVLAERFPQQLGYKIYASDTASLLLLKLEALERSAASAFREFLAIDYCQPVSSNLAEDKWYASLYREFKRSKVIPDDYLAQQYSTDAARHFYTDDELNRFADRWRQLET